ncbi:hypothetical protein PYCC9005_005734 [Savitreella phatthalungensis]
MSSSGPGAKRRQLSSSSQSQGSTSSSSLNGSYGNRLPRPTPSGSRSFGTNSHANGGGYTNSYGLSSASHGSSSSSSPSDKTPCIILVPLNETFEPKCITLSPLPEVVRVGRQTNKSTCPGPENAYFDSKVLSRAHAELWCDGGGSGRVFIKDIRSSNGTFINGIRLSKENEESEPRELCAGDSLDLGIDILDDDSGAIIHRKVSARVEHAGIPSATANTHRPAINGRPLKNLQAGPHNGRSNTVTGYDLGYDGTTSNNSGVSTVGRSNTVTVEMVVRKLTSDLRLSRRQADDLRGASDAFERIGSGTTRSGYGSSSLLSVRSSSDELTLARQQADEHRARAEALDAQIADERAAREVAEQQWRSLLASTTSSATNDLSLDTSHTDKSPSRSPIHAHTQTDHDETNENDDDHDDDDDDEDVGNRSAFDFDENASVVTLTNDVGHTPAAQDKEIGAEVESLKARVRELETLVETKDARIAQLEAELRQRHDGLRNRKNIKEDDNDNDNDQAKEADHGPPTQPQRNTHSKSAVELSVSRVTALGSCLGVVVIGLGLLSLLGSSD